jgi:hypothetical protein
MLFKDMDATSTRKILSIYDKAHTAAEKLEVTDTDAFVRGIGQGIWSFVAIGFPNRDPKNTTDVATELSNDTEMSKPDFVKGMVVGMVALMEEVRMIETKEEVIPGVAHV